MAEWVLESSKITKLIIIKEIRDEGAVGRGSKPKVSLVLRPLPKYSYIIRSTFQAGLCGFSVSDLLIPDFKQPWELDVGKPSHITSSFDIVRRLCSSPIFI